MLTIALLIVGALLALLGWAAISDAISFRIPNRIVLGIAALYPLWVAAAWPVIDPLSAAAVGAGALAIGVLLFRAGWLGGGDAKLLAVVALWAGPEQLPRLLLVTAIAGAVVAALSLGAAMRIGPFSAALRRPIPYGVAIAIGGGAVALSLAGTA